MIAKRSQRPVTRRSFLKTVGAAATAGLLSACNPVTQLDHALRSVARSGPPLDVGVLVPRSTIYPQLGEHLLAGMRLRFEQDEHQVAGRPVRLIAEDIGFGQSLISAKAQKLLHADRAALVVGTANTSLAAALHKTLYESRRFLILANVGANIPRGAEQSPFLFQHSLSHWQANWALGDWAGHSQGRRGFMALSFYDSGYDAPYAFRAGFERAGGEVVGTGLSHVPPAQATFGPLFAQIEDARPDFVYASYSGPQAVDFVRAYADSGFAGRIPLIGSAFLVDEAILPAQGAAALGIRTAFPWATGMDGAIYQSSAATHGEQSDQALDVFTILGFETADLIVGAADAVDGDLGQIDQFRAALRHAEIASPRGRLSMNPETHHTLSPLFLREVQRQGTISGNVVISRLGVGAEDDPQIQSLQSKPRSGWLNTYLSV
jgi:branched-chain amino acid transport system substrate-binding protein